jgi:hypothetical protein
LFRIVVKVSFLYYFALFQAVQRKSAEDESEHLHTDLVITGKGKWLQHLRAGFLGRRQGGGLSPAERPVCASRGLS